MERPAEERESFALHLCNEDATLLSQLLILLRADPAQTESIDTITAQFSVDGYQPAFYPNEVLLDRFRIVRFLGLGGMGEVYEAEDSETGRIALKTIRPEIAEHPHTLARFRHEVQCARKATGTNVCRIHELFTLPASSSRPATAFLTMEFLQGITLSERISTGSPLSTEEAEKIAVQICRGLRTIHEADIIHRDLKSRNIMLAQRKHGIEAVLMDFGLAREARATSVAAAAGSSSAVPGTIAGTPQYMAPEQFQGGALTPATDIYALGIVLYEMATGKLPFEGSTPLAAAAERAKPIAPASSLRQGLAHRWDSTIERCLRYQPEARFQTAQEIAQALTARSMWPVPARVYADRHPRTAIVAGVAAITLIAVLSVFWYRSYNKPAAGSAAAKHWYTLGTTALREGTYLKAANALQWAVRLDKNFVLAHARLADAWNELDFADEAKDEMLKASALEAGGGLSTLDQEYVSAVRHTIVREFPAALRDYQHIFDALPRESKADGYIDLGRAQEKAGNTNDAITSYSNASKLDPENPASFLRLGILESRRKHTADADAAFTKAESLYDAASNLEGVAEVAFQRGNDANTRLRLDDARKYLNKSLQAAEAIHNPQLEIRALTRLCVTEYLNRDSSKAIELANQAIALAQENRLEYWVIDGSIRLGNAYISRNDYRQAGEQLERALTLAEHNQHPRLIALAQLSLAFVRERQDRPEQVIPLARAALDYYRSVGFASESVEALTEIVRAERNSADNEAALKSGQELLAFAAKLNTPAAIMRAEESIGSVLLNLERYPDALDHFQKALAASRAVNSQTEYQLLHCANVSWRLGNYQQATRTLASIAPGSQTRPNVQMLTDEITSAMLFSQKRYAAAKEIARRALDDKSNADPGYFERLLGEIETVSGSPTRAEDWCQKALAQAQTESDRVAAAAANLALANAYLAARSPSQALPFAQTAHDFFAASGQRESEYLSLLSLAKIAAAVKNLADSKKFAREGMDILYGLIHNWSPQQYTNYTTRPDVRDARAELARLAS